MAGEIALFLINQVLEETPSTWVPGDPLYDDPRQEDEDENFNPQPSVYVRPMFELLYDDPDDHPHEYFFGSWDERRSSYRYRPPLPPFTQEEIDKLAKPTLTSIQGHSVMVYHSITPPPPSVLTALATWRLDP